MHYFASENSVIANSSVRSWPKTSPSLSTTLSSPFSSQITQPDAFLSIPRAQSIGIYSIAHLPQVRIAFVDCHKLFIFILPPQPFPSLNGGEEAPRRLEAENSCNANVIKSLLRGVVSGPRTAWLERHAKICPWYGARNPLFKVRSILDNELLA
jgi:hypothetical protein